MTPITVDVSESTLAMIDEIAANMKADRSAVLREALVVFARHYKQELADAQQADCEYENGERFRTKMFSRG